MRAAATSCEAARSRRSRRDAHVAFDLGASNGRAILGRYDGAAIELEEVHRFATPSARLPDGLYWDALGMYRELIGSVAGLGDVRSIGIDSWGVDFGLLDDHGALVANPLSYRDGRAADHVTVALRRVPADELYAATGIQLLPIDALSSCSQPRRTWSARRRCS